MTKIIASFCAIALTLTASVLSAEDYPRHRLTPKQRADIFEKSRSRWTGKVYDPKTGAEIKSSDKWDAGHKPGQEFWRAKEEAQKTGMSREEFRASQKNTDLYRPELPSSNRSHAMETLRTPPRTPKTPTGSGPWLKYTSKTLKWLSKAL